MFERYSRILVFVIGWALLCSFNIPDYNSSEVNSAGIFKDKKSSFVLSNVPLHDSYRPKLDDERCYSADNLTIADLCAQWRAAKAAEVNVWVALIGSIFSFASMLIVLVNLMQANKANRISGEAFLTARAEATALARDTASALAQARRSADAAIDAVAQAARANEISINAGRPIIVSGNARDRVTLEQSYQGRTIKSGITFEVIWTNIGGRLALDARIWSEWRIVKAGEKAPTFDGSRLLQDEPKVIIPNVPAYSPYCILNDEQSVAFKNSSIEVILYGICSYTDITGLVGLTEVCFRAECHGQTRNPEGLLVPHVMYRATGPQNRTI